MSETPGQRIPNFFIVGAAKSGTTSLWRYLEQHPQVFMPGDVRKKEPAYFSDLHGMRSRQRYLRLFARATDSHVAIGEASTAYLTDPAAPDRIRAAVPDARIVILLRNPVDRAFSLYNWMAQEGYEFAADFEAALAREPKRASGRPARWMDAYYHNYLYLGSGFYHDQVRRYLERFPEERVGVWLFEDLAEDPASVYRGVCRLLEIDDGFVPEFERHNVSRSPYYPPLQFALRKINDAITKIRRMSGWIPGDKRRRDFLVNLGIRDRGPPDLDSTRRRELLALYREDIRELQRLLGRSLDRWLDE